MDKTYKMVVIDETKFIDGFYDINHSGEYTFSSNINCKSDNKYCININADNVILDGNNYSIEQTNDNIYDKTGINITKDVKNIIIKNIIIKNISGCGVWVNGGNSKIKLINIKLENCSYFCVKKLKVTILDCYFRESGIKRGKIKYSKYTSSLLIRNTDNINIKGCTIDGCVGLNISWAVVLSGISDLLIDDIFITDVYSSRDSKDLYHYDIDAKILGVVSSSLVSNVHPSKYINYLDNHTSYKETVTDEFNGVIEARLLKNVIPDHGKNEELLVNEHKWRDFRTLGRLVCHHSHQKSKTSAIYAKWVELFCDKVFGVKVRVETGFANLYTDGNVNLPIHRDQYKKWIFGLSFGGTRTIDFIPAKEDMDTLSYSLESGDVLIFSHDINNRYQHRMLPDPKSTKRRVNITYFIDILEGDCNNLLNSIINTDNIPTFNDAINALS